jgi:hypothetical protein
MTTEPRGAGDVAVRLVREIHRRKSRYESGPSAWAEIVRTHMRGELLGLQVALGIALGHAATGDEGLKAASRFYRRWLTAGMPEVMPP